MKASSIQVPNQSGTYKKFRSLLAPGVAAWKASSDAVKGTRAAKPKKQTHKEILERGDDAIGAGFPDGDPIDHLLPYMRLHNLTIHDFDQVYNKEYKIRSGFYGYVAILWGEQQRDAIGDANRIAAARDPYSNYYFIKEGNIVPKANPWLV